MAAILRPSNTRSRQRTPSSATKPSGSASGGRARQLVIETGAAGDKARFKTGKVWVAAVRHSAEVAIKAGENSGRKMTYTNVVLGLTEAGVWEGAPTSYAVRLSAIPKGWEMLVAFLQAEPLGPIIGAVQLHG